MQFIFPGEEDQIKADIKTEDLNLAVFDDFLDETTIFDDFENIIPDEEFPIFVIAILNNYKSDVIIDKLVNSILSIKK